MLEHFNGGDVLKNQNDTVVGYIEYRMVLFLEGSRTSLFSFNVLNICHRDAHPTFDPFLEFFGKYRYSKTVNISTGQAAN